MWLLCSAIGAVVIALPDSGRRVFSISSAHGPSAADLVGVLVMLSGWAVFLWTLWVSRRMVGRTGHPPGTPFVAGVGLGLVVASVSDYSQWWLFGAILLAGAQLRFAYSLISGAPSDGRIGPRVRRSSGVDGQ